MTHCLGTERLSVETLPTIASLALNPVQPAGQPVMAMQSGAIARGPRWWPIWLAWTVFVVYGSLVPLDFHPLPWLAAWQRLLDAPMLNLGVESRADWIANGVLYLPVGYLTTAMLAGRGHGRPRKLAASVMGLGFGLGLATAVELAQTAFPQRTVSRNDLLAEAIGSGLGMLAAWGGARPLWALLQSLAEGGARLRRLLAPAYLLAFAAWALFPFDLLLNAAEWQRKLQADHAAWLLADASQGLGTVQTLTKLMAEALATAPIGAWWAASRLAAHQTPRRASLGRAVLAGAALGLAVELTQLLIASGISQGASVLTRALGFAAGAWAWTHSAHWHVETVRSLLRRATGLIVALYLPLLGLQSGWGSGPLLGWDRAWQRLAQDVRLIPLYYHYFTSEAHALVSLVSTLACYAPMGLLGWGWHLGAGTSAWLAGLLSMVIEAGRLMTEGAKPDPTNVLIAAAAAWVAHRLAIALTSDPAHQRRPST